jgi:D-alanyl-D-alanine carboxypeptidase
VHNKWFVIGLTAVTLLLSACEKEVAIDPRAYNCTDDFAAASNAHPKRDQYQAFINDHWIKKGLPGAILLVRDRHGLWVGAGGMADLANHVPMKPCNSFRIASVTKTLHAAAVMRLQEKGMLHIDHKVVEYLPEFKEIPYGDEMTIRQLLNHTSGIGGDNFVQGTLDYFNNAGHPFRTLGDYVQTFKKGALFRPGTGFSYSSGPDIAGVIVERVTGKRPYQVIREEIVEPLGMRGTILDDNYATGNLPKKYMDLQANGKIIELKIQKTPTQPGSVDFVSGGGISTAHNLMVFIEALSKGGLVQPTTLAEMRKPVPIPAGMEGWDGFSGYGVGLSFLETPYGTAMGHEGDGYGYSSFMFHFPDQDVTVVGFMNVTSKPFRDVFRNYNALVKVVYE